MTLHFLDADHGGFYAVTSGWLALVLGCGFVIRWERQTICHEPWCVRKGHHPTADGMFKVCRRHHPDLPDKLERGHIARCHREAKGEG